MAQICIIQAVFTLILIVGLSDGLDRMEKEAQISRKIFPLTYPETLSTIRPSGTRDIGTSATDVIISRLFIDVQNVDERLSSVDMAMIVDITWQDNRLRWDTTDNPNCTKNVDCLSDVEALYGSIATRVWRPDLRPYNLHQELTYEIITPKVAINSSGFVHYQMRSTFNVICEFDTTDFPYDKASCVVKYGSGLYPKQELNLILPHFPEPEEIGVTKHHSDWQVSISTMVIEDLSGDHQSLFLQVVLNMTRIPDYFNLVYKSPGLLMASYLPIIHLLPPDNQAKLILPSLCSVAVVMLISTFETNIGRFPPGGSPLIIINYVFLLILLLISTVWSCFTSSLVACKHTTRILPGFLRKILKNLVIRKLCTFGADWSEDFAAHRFSHQRLQEDQEELVHNDVLNNTSGGDNLDILCKFAKGVEARQRMEREWYQFAVILDRFAATSFALLLVISYAIQ